MIFEEHKTQSKPQRSNDKITGRPATPFPSPSLKGQQQVRDFLECQKLNANTDEEDKAELTNHPEYPELTYSANPDSRRGSTDV
jgi:hypothetical protein